MGVHSLKPDPDRSDGAGATSVSSPGSRRAVGGRAPAPASSTTAAPANRARHARAPARTERSRRRNSVATALGKPGPADSVPFHHRKGRFLGAVVVVALALSVAGYLLWRGSGPGRPCGPDYVGKQVSDVCADERGTVAMDNLTVSSTPLAATDNGTGGLTLCSDVTLSNNSDSKQDYNVQDFMIQNAEGQQDPPDPAAIAGTLRSGSLGPGGTKTGRICDDRPAQKGLYALIYAPSLFDSRRGIWLSQR